MKSSSLEPKCGVASKDSPKKCDTEGKHLGVSLSVKLSSPSGKSTPVTEQSKSPPVKLSSPPEKNTSPAAAESKQEKQPSSKPSSLP